jgi:hypothetical protein
MLTLHRDNRTIVTDEDFSVKLKWVNPACFMDSVPGDVGLGIDISVNEYTRAEFGNPQRVEKYTSGNDRKFPNVSIRFSGFLLMRGTLVITSATTQKYTAWLQSELGVLGTAQRDKFINEMAWKTDVPLLNTGSHDRDYDFTTIQNPVFWEGKGKSTTETIDTTDEFGNPMQIEVEKNALTRSFEFYQAGRVNRMNGISHEVLTDGDACVVSPFLKLSYVVKEIFRMNGFFVEDPTDFDWASLLVYHNFNIYRQTFTIHPTDIGYWDYNLNDWIDQSFDAVIWSWTLGNFDYSNLVPKMPLKDFILGIQNFLNLVFHFKQDQSVKVINRNNIPDTAPYSLDAYFLGEWIVGEQKDVRLKFTQEFDKDDQLYDDWHDLSDRLADFGEPVADIDALKALPDPQLGELRLVTSLNKIYEYKWAVFDAIDENFNGDQTDILEWVFVSTGNQPYQYGTSDEIEEVKTGCSTLTYHDDGISWIMPETLYTRQKGNLYSSKSLWGDFGLRLIYMRDYFNVFKGYLEYDGENGLFARRWEKWARFWKTRLPIEGDFRLPMNELYYLINNITQPYSTRNCKFIIEEMECEFKGGMMGDVHVKGYKL